MNVLTREEKRKFRSLLFKHQDGLAICNTIAILENEGLFDFFIKNKQTTVGYILEYFPKLNAGYLNVALRSLASQGIFDYDIYKEKISINTTQKFNDFVEQIVLYKEFANVYIPQLELLNGIFNPNFSIDSNVLRLSHELKELRKQDLNNKYYHSEVLIHLEGVLLLPILVYLNYNADLEQKDVKKLISENKSLQLFLQNLSILKENKLTKKGQFLFDKSYAYGVTTSYLPIMANVNEYLKGDFNKFFNRDKEGNEKHVFRGINVWGSGGSHSTYFKKIDTVLLDIFNRPLNEQPKGIIDVGCGNGALLEHMFNLIWSQTNRREDLHKNKLILIGADYNKEALLSTQRNLKRADVWAEVVWGDIGNPSEIDEKLQKLYNVKLKDLLNIRSFLDHNRPFNTPEKESNLSILSTGAFVHRGKLLDNRDVEQSLLEHLLKWKPYIEEHGLLVIELHTIQPKTVSLNLGNTPCTAYDVTHGFSDQYIVEIDVFKEAVTRAGLSMNKDHNHRFPNSELSTVSINLIS